jgi:AcrR family transcriptional regulator
MKKKKRDPKQTQAAILDAACRIFAEQSYTAASIRTIAREGGVPHALIRYYYPTKADLFDAVAQKICTDLYQVCESAFVEVSRMERVEGFALFIQRLIEFSKHQPWTFRIFLLNLSSETLETVPGQARMIGAVESIRTAMIRSLQLKASHEEICRFTDSFNALVFYYLGTPASAAWLLRLDPESAAYTDWVHKTLMHIFLPTLNDLFHADPG